GREDSRSTEQKDGANARGAFAERDGVGRRVAHGRGEAVFRLDTVEAHSLHATGDLAREVLVHSALAPLAGPPRQFGPVVSGIVCRLEELRCPTRSRAGPFAFHRGRKASRESAQST